MVATATLLAGSVALHGQEAASLDRYPLDPGPTSALGAPTLNHPSMRDAVRLPPPEESLPPAAVSRLRSESLRMSRRQPPLEELPPAQPMAPPHIAPPPAPVSPPPPAALPPVPKSGLEALEQSIVPHGEHDDIDADCGAHRVPYFGEDFGDNIEYQLDYDACGELGAYEGKSAIPTQRPWIEWGRPFYDWGPFPPSSTILGDTNLAASQFLLYGDFRTAGASNNTGANSTNLIASRLNLEMDWKVTSTERFHASFQPMNKGQNFTQLAFSSSELDFEEEFNIDPFTGYFEGDVGAMWGGLTGQVLPFEMPLAVGFMPLVFQNGIWLEDNVIGAAVTLPAMNSPAFDIPNYDITFFCLFDEVTSPAFQGDNDAALAYGVAGFFDMLDGYVELDYAYLDDRTRFDRSYHNLGIGYTRRYFSFLSNSVRVISNLGQDPNGIDATADGVMLITENSLITENPYLFVPYFNTFVGFRRVQSVARNGAAGGILRNTGILFETDNLTGFPTLDPTGNETYGGAVGLNLIPATIDRQLVVEYAFVGVLDDVALRQARGNQHGLGVRFQKNLTKAWLMRTDAMYGFRENEGDIGGARAELRYKF
jgi:hypothetical protein